MQLIKNIKVNYAKKITRKTKKEKGKKVKRPATYKHWWNFSKLTN